MGSTLKNKFIDSDGGPSFTASLDYFNRTGSNYCYSVTFSRIEDGLIVESGTKLFYTFNSAVRYFNKLN